MDPLVGKAAETVIEKTVTALYEQIKKADTFAYEDVNRCKIYLETANAAIQGLENEHDAILNQAEICRLDQREHIRELQGRILNYLNLDRFRAVLWDVHAGLTGCRTALQANNERFWVLPGVREKRQEAITDFVNTMEALEQYIADLQDRDLRYRRAGTGIGISWLMGIKDYLSSADNLYERSIPPDSDQLATIRKKLVKYVNEARQDRSKDRLEYSTTRIRETIEKLIRTFR